MRVALDGRVISDHFPGIGRYAYHLADALAPLAPDDAFTILHHPGTHDARYDVQALARHANVTLQPVDVPVFALAQQWQLPRPLAPLALDAYHAPYYVYPYRLPVPTLLTLFDIISHTHPHTLPTLRARLLFEATTRLALRAAQHVLVPSQATADALAAAYAVPQEQMTVTPLAADARFRPVSAAEVTQVRQRHHLPPRYTLYFGSNKPHKNLVRLVRAWAQLVQQGRAADAILVIAGYTDPRYPQAQARAIELGMLPRIRFLGPLAEAELPALYTGALAFVFPSLAEGFGLPLLEAMACGAPVLCGNLSSLPEVAGDAAMQVDPLDVDALAAGMAQLLDDDALRETLRERGLARVAAFTWERTAAATLDAYRRVLAT